MKKLLIIANPAEKSFTKSMLASYIQKLEKEKITYEVLDLYEQRQDFLCYNSKDDFKNPDFFQQNKMKDFQEKIISADEMVFFFPVWWGTMPAILKNFFDVNLQAGFAYKYVK